VNTVVLFGGQSGERRVSVASAQNVCRFLPTAQYAYWAPDGRIVVVNRETLLGHQEAFERDFLPTESMARFDYLAAYLDSLQPRRSATVVVMALHGGAGEDGRVQRALEQHDLAFTGSDSTASANAFDKTLAKALVRSAGGKTAESAVLPPDDAIAIRAAIEELFHKHGRVVVKPIADGSSVGLYHVKSAEDVQPVAAAVSNATVAYLAEAFVSGPELTVGVAHDRTGRARVLCASEVRLDPGRVFDFAGKYLGKGTIELTPAEQPPAVCRAAEELALLAHNALGCEGYSRTDVICAEDGPVFLETNTLPGLTKASFIPQQLAAINEDFADFLQTQIELAVIRRDRWVHELKTTRR
jgi:D-alanine-D-alanine ligase